MPTTPLLNPKLNVSDTLRKSPKERKSVKKIVTDDEKSFYPVSIIYDNHEFVQKPVRCMKASSPFLAASKIATRCAEKNELESGSIKISLKEKGKDKVYMFDVERSLKYDNRVKKASV
jgi:hypothetical protein